MVETTKALLAAASALEIKIPNGSDEKVRQIIAEYVHELIHRDFNRLINLLYRMDISENKLRKLLEENPDSDAGIIISDLIIERQEQKIRSKQENKNPPVAGADELW